MLNFTCNRRCNYSCGTFLIIHPKKKGGKWIILNGSARRHEVAFSGSLEKAKNLVQALARIPMGVQSPNPRARPIRRIFKRLTDAAYYAPPMVRVRK